MVCFFIGNYLVCWWCYAKGMYVDVPSPLNVWDKHTLSVSDVKLENFRWNWGYILSHRLPQINGSRFPLICWNSWLLCISYFPLVLCGYESYDIHLLLSLTVYVFSPNYDQVNSVGIRDMENWLDLGGRDFQSISKSWLRASEFLCPQSRLKSTRSFMAKFAF